MVIKHRAPCFKEDGEPICFPPPKPSPPKLKKNRCPYSKAITHQYMSECFEFQALFPKKKTAVQPPPPPSSISFPQSDRMSEDEEEDERFSGYDVPRGVQGGNTGGNAGGIPPRDGNVAGAGDPGDSDSFSDRDDSDSPPPHSRKILGRRKEHWDDARKRKYDRRYAKLLKLFKKAKRGRNSGPAKGNQESWEFIRLKAPRLIPSGSYKMLRLN